MTIGDLVWVCDHFEHKVLDGVVVRVLSNSYMVDTPTGRRNIKFENCCTTEYSARISLDDEIEELSRNNEIGKRLCMPSALGLDLVRDHIQNGGY